MFQFSYFLNRIEILAVHMSLLNKAGRQGEEVMDGFELFSVYHPSPIVDDLNQFSYWVIFLHLIYFIVYFRQR